MRILVIEDNPKMASAIKAGLEQHGYVADAFTRGTDGERVALERAHDVIVLDVMLPDRDGIELCRSLRQQGLGTPIIMLTAISGTADKVRGLDAGADDYLTKPFEIDELIARVRALLRRGQATESARIEYEDLVLDLRKRSVTREGEPVALSAKEFVLLEYFVRNPDRVISRQSIAESVWDMNYEPASNVIDVYISALRRKIDKPFEHPFIHTVIGSGYRFGRHGGG